MFLLLRNKTLSVIISHRQEDQAARTIQETITEFLRINNTKYLCIIYLCMYKIFMYTSVTRYVKPLRGVVYC